MFKILLNWITPDQNLSTPHFSSCSFRCTTPRFLYLYDKGSKGHLLPTMASLMAHSFNWQEAPVPPTNWMGCDIFKFIYKFYYYLSCNWPKKIKCLGKFWAISNWFGNCLNCYLVTLPNHLMPIFFVQFPNYYLHYKTNFV